MTEPTVSASYAKALFDLAVEKGANREALSQQSNLNEGDLLDLHQRIPLSKFKTLMQAGKSLTAEPGLALYFGTNIIFDDLSIVGLICRSAPTMEAAFAEMNRYGRLIIEVESGAADDRFKIERRDGRVWIIDQRLNPNDFPALTESTLGRFIGATRHFFPNRHFFKSAKVTHAEPDYVALYDKLLGVPIEFDADENAMEVDETWLAMKINPKRNYVFGMLSQQANALLEELEASKSVRGQVERVLISILHTGDIGMDRVSEELGQSSKALYRSLREEGAVFKTILDHLRRELALSYISGQKVSVAEVAYLVGFSDPSAFSRAFKRWTGKSPKAFADAV